MNKIRLFLTGLIVTVSLAGCADRVEVKTPTPVAPVIEKKTVIETK